METSEQHPRITRRQLLQAGTIGLTVSAAGCSWQGNMPLVGSGARQQEGLDMRLGASDLVVQPVLTYNVSQRREARSWRNWGDVHTEEAAQQEGARVTQELNQLCRSADFGVRVLPLAKVTNRQQASALKIPEADVLVVYAAGSGTDTLNALAALDKSMIIFVRKHTKPYYLWDEIVHSRFLRSHSDSLSQPKVDYNDVAVDDHQEIIWRLRALYGLKNTMGRRIICVGGPGGWSYPKAPELARERFGLDMVTVTIPEMRAMIEAARKKPELMAQCHQQAQAYLKAGRVKLSTSEEAVADAFLLKQLFHDLMDESEAFAVTTRGCMGTYAGIIPCLTLTLINDGGHMAYCEGDLWSYHLVFSCTTSAASRLTSATRPIPIRGAWYLPTVQRRAGWMGSHWPRSSSSHTMNRTMALPRMWPSVKVRN